MVLSDRYGGDLKETFTYTTQQHVQYWRNISPQCQSVKPPTHCSSLISLFQATLGHGSNNLGMPSNLMYADDAMITPTEPQASEASLAAHEVHHPSGLYSVTYMSHML